jgi:PAS domain S-box-containing protein
MTQEPKIAPPNDAAPAPAARPLSFVGTLAESLRARLLILILLASVPVLGLLVLNAAEQRRQKANEARSDALQLVKLVAIEQERLTEGSRQLLVALAQEPAVYNRDSATCNKLFTKLLASFPQYSNIGVCEPGGAVFGSAAPLDQPVSYCGFAWFQRSKETGGFAVGDYQVGQVEQEPVLFMGQSVRDDSSQVVAVVYCSLKLKWLNETLRVSALSPGTTLQVLDRNGIILAHHPEPEKWLGHKTADTQLMEQALTKPEGMVEVPGRDNMRWLFAFSHPENGSSAQLIVVIGIPSDILLAEADLILKRNLLWMGIVFVAMLFAVFFISQKAVLRPVETLVQVTQRLGAGDLKARVGIIRGGAELNRIGRALDEMSAALEERETARQQAVGELQERAKEQEAARAIIGAVVSSPELQAVLDLSLRGMIELTGLEGGTLCLLDNTTQSLRLATAINTSPETIADLTRNFVKIGDCLCGECARTCKPLILWDNASGSKFATRESTRNEGIRFHAAFPLVIKGQTIGVLCLFSKSERRPTQRSLDLANNLCCTIALVIENARVWEQARQELSERKRAEAELLRTQRTLRLISECNQALVQAKDEAVMLQSVCRSAIDVGGYRMAWVGFAEDDEGKTVRTAAQAGFEEGYLEKARITWADTERGCGPMGTAIRTGRCIVAQDFKTDPAFAPWIEESLVLGYASAIALPLAINGKTIGGFMLYSAIADSINPTEQTLLTELAGDVAYGINALRGRKARDEAEEELRQSRSLLLSISEGTTDAIFIKDLAGRYIMLNSATAQFFRKSASEVLGKDDTAFFPADEALKIMERDRRTFESGVTQTYEETLSSPDGLHTFLATKGPIHDGQGNPIGTFGIVRDITDFKQVQQELSKTRDILQVAMDQSTAGIAIADAPTGALRYVNDAGLLIGGGTREKLVERVSIPEYVARWQLLDLNGQPLAMEEVPLTRAVLYGERASREFIIRRAPNDDRLVMAKAAPIKDNKGKVTAGVVVFLDITEHRQAEISLRKVQALLDATSQKARMGGWEVELPSMALTWTSEIYRIYEVDPEFVPTVTGTIEFYAPESRPIIAEAVRRAIEYGEAFDLKLFLITAKGNRKTVQAVGQAHQLNGMTTRLSGTFQDITESRRAEEARQAASAETARLLLVAEQSRRALLSMLEDQKLIEGSLQGLLREKEALLREVHHRVKNNLQVISSLMRLGGGQIDNAKATDLLDELQGRVRAMSLLHETLYRVGSFDNIDMPAYLQAICRQIMRSGAGRHCGQVDLRVEVAPLRLEMPQAAPCGLLINELVTNCLKHAFPGGRGGVVWVRLHPLDTEQTIAEYVGSAPECSSATRLRLSVSDNGVGLPAGFDLKQLRSLGLQLAEDFSRQLHGKLEIGNTPDCGGALFAVAFSPTRANNPRLPTSPSPCPTHGY